MRLTLGKEVGKKPEKKSSQPEFSESPKGFFIELVKIVLIALAVILPIRYFLFQPFYVRGASMEPNFYDNEYLIIDEITYRFSEPKRGDVVVIKLPQQKNEFLIKRLIGLPGDTLESRGNQVAVINEEFPEGIVLDEKYLGDGINTTNLRRVTLEDDEYFFMGDNRPVSLDSRYFGPLPSKDIIGRAWLRVWPFKNFQHFSPPEYNYANI